MSFGAARGKRNESFVWDYNGVLWRKMQGFRIETMLGQGAGVEQDESSVVCICVSIYVCMYVLLFMS